MRRGDVVLVDFPFSNRMGTKLRPAIVVQADALNAILSNIVLALVTTRSRHNDTEVAINPFHEANSGLLAASYISCNNLLTIDSSLIVRAIGSISNAGMKQVDDRLRISLGI